MNKVSKVIAVMANKGGVGKSTWAASLTHAFNKASGKNWAVLVDMDPSRIATMLVSPNCHGRGSLSYITSRSVLEMCTKDTDGGEVDVVPPGEAFASLDDAALKAFDDMVATLAERYYIIVVDLPGAPLEYSKLVHHVVDVADMVVVVTTQESIHMARRLKTILKDKLIYVVLNQYIDGYGGDVDARMISQSRFGYLYTICRFSGCVKDAVMRKVLPTLACKEFEKCVDEAASKILSVLHKL